MMLKTVKVMEIVMAAEMGKETEIRKARNAGAGLAMKREYLWATRHGSNDSIST